MIFAIYIIFVFAVLSLFDGHFMKVDLSGGICIHSILSARE